MLPPTSTAWLLLFAVLAAGVAKGTDPPERVQQPERKVLKPRVPLAPPVRPERPAIPPPADLLTPADGAETTASGLTSRVLQPGRADEAGPGPDDLVTLRYTGWSADGNVVDTTEPDKPARTFGVAQAIPGFAEGLQLMTPGERRRLWIPESLAYAGRAGKPAGSLVFDIELQAIRRAPAPPADVASVPDDAVRTPSGLAYRVLQSADGERPGPEDMVVVHFNAWKADGRLFDSSVLRDDPAHFALDNSVPGFREIFPQMAVGERRRLWLTPELARAGEETAIEGLTVFDVELLSFLRKPQPPASLVEPPDDAERTITGLATRVERSGHGERHPQTGSRVKVHYAGWKRDGEMFDASFNHGEPGVFTLDAKMPRGFVEGLRLMVEGERRLLWIPEDLAFGGQKGRPEGLLIFDVELLEILD